MRCSLTCNTCNATERWAWWSSSKCKVACTAGERSCGFKLALLNRWKDCETEAFLQYKVGTKKYKMLPILYKDIKLHQPINSETCVSETKNIPVFLNLSKIWHKLSSEQHQQVKCLQLLCTGLWRAHVRLPSKTSKLAPFKNHNQMRIHEHREKARSELKQST